MKTNPGSRRTFLVAAATVAAAPFLPAQPTADRSANTLIAEDFLKNWIAAWNSHDAHAMSLLHTEDAVTINRFGTLVPGREALEKALGFLHAPNGPYREATLPPLQLLGVRQLAPNVIVLQASWKSPVMTPDGKLDMSRMDDMVVSYTLLHTGPGWRAAEVDLHNVEKMNLPYSDASQKS